MSILLDDNLRLKALSAVECLNVDQVAYIATDLVEALQECNGDLVIELHNLSIYDQSTHEHSLNVALTAVSCGIGMGLTNDQLEHLATASLLHDIGKTQVPIQIINKPDKLTSEERFLVERHPQYGYDMLYNKPEIHSEARAAVLCHHENQDGSGYGRKLSGNQIPILARIIHVADVYDALVKKRAYKDKLSQTECIEYLMGGCGTLFDFDCVSTFLKYIAVYPVGCRVKLSDGRIARVIKNTKGLLERPVVMYEDKILDLANDKTLLNLTIIDEVDEDEEDTEE